MSQLVEKLFVLKRSNSVLNGGGMILNAITSVALFKEKLSVKKWIGIAIGLVAMLLLVVEL